jgi:hypothetical protein
MVVTFGMPLFGSTKKTRNCQIVLPKKSCKNQKKVTNTEKMHETKIHFQKNQKRTWEQVFFTTCMNRKKCYNKIVPPNQPLDFKSAFYSQKKEKMFSPSEKNQLKKSYPHPNKRIFNMKTTRKSECLKKWKLKRRRNLYLFLSV